MPDAIKVGEIPGDEIKPDVIEENARTIGTISGQVAEHGSNVHFRWQGMAGVYEAPESPTLLGLMAPVSSQATQASDNLAEVSAALIAFAADVRPIKAELDALRVQAQAFVDSIAGGVQVREINPAWTAAQSPYGGATAAPAYQGSWGSSTTSTPATPDKYRTVTKEWHESQEHVDRNNELIAAVNAQQVKLWEAERACANRIRALYGAQPLHAATSEDDSLGYGISEIPEGTEMPWGADVERTEGCAEATATFVVKDFLWEGIVVGGIWGTVEGLGTLVLGYNPATGEFFSGEAYGAAWGNLGLLAFSGLANSPLLGPLFWTDSLFEATGMGGVLPQEVRDFKAKADEAALNTGKALIAWDKWADDPGTAAGEAVFNIGTILIPAGAAVTGVKTASAAASVVSKTARFVDFVDPGALAMNGAIRLGGAGLHSLDGIIGRLGANATDGFHLNTPDMPFVADDAPSALRALDDAGVDLNSITARIEDGVPVYEFPPTDAIPSGRIEMPAGSFDGVVPIRNDGGADTAVAAPVREPELVSAGGVRGEAGPGAVNSIVEEAPVRTETGGSGDSTVVREPSTETGGGSSHAGGESGGHGGSDTGNGGGLGRGDDAGSAGHGDNTGNAGRDDDAPGTHSDDRVGHDEGVDANRSDNAGAAHGNDRPGVAGDGGIVEGPAHRGDPVDPHYGEPRSEHGQLADRYLPPENVPEPVRHLVTDPSAPFGRGSDGHAFTRGEWESMYVDTDGNLIYPGNDGAVQGTRVTYTDVGAFRRDYGDTLDRFGGDYGSYFAPEGTSFERRGLPGGSLSTPYRTFGIADQLPPGVRIEVSEVAPAFGQPGGGIQVQFVNDTDGPISLGTLHDPGTGMLYEVRPGEHLNLESGAFSDLATRVPGSTHVVALHDGSVPVEYQRSLLRREYPGFLGINSSRYTGGVGHFDLNCTRCVIATDRLLDGSPSSAMPVRGNGAPVTDITRALGTENGFQITDSWATITDDMSRLPIGSRGVVLIERPSGIGHVVNVVHDQNGVVFLDAQSGRFAHLEDAFRLRLLITKGNVN